MKNIPYKCRLLIFFIILLSPFLAYAAEDSVDFWYRSNADNESTKSSPYDQINKNNISNLKLDWKFNSGIRSYVETNPVFTGDSIVTAFNKTLFSIDPLNGKKKWSVEFDADIAKRGLTYFNKNLYVPTEAGLYEVNAISGIKIRKFGNGTSYLPPVIFDDILVIGNFTSIEAWNLRDNKKIWERSLIKDEVAARLWSGLSFDEKNKIVYVVTSNSGYLEDANIKDGGYSSSVLAINALNGSIIWQFQDIKHDIWDLDVVGPPILLDIELNKKIVPSIIALTKSGKTLYLNRLSGKPIFPISFTKTTEPEFENKNISRKQLKILKPEPFADTFFNIQKDVTKISDDKKNYVLYKLRNVRNGELLPTSIKYDVAMFGLHGGAEWPGGALSRDKKILIIPSNKYPWILRKNYFDKDENEILNLSKRNQIYMNKCIYCHGADLRGAHLSETQGDYYFPSLIGISHKRSNDYLNSVEEFKKNHLYISDAKTIDTKQFKKILSKVNYGSSKLESGPYNNFIRWIDKLRRINKNDSKKIISNVGQEDLSNLSKFFTNVDHEVWRNQNNATEAFWQLVLDQSRLPGSQPPWGLLTAISLDDGKTLWKQPFGYAYDSINKKYYDGDMNFGGVMTLGSDIFFANGTRDSNVYAYDIHNGKKIWEEKMPAAGSAPPMTYMYKGCQYIVFTATGNRYIGDNKKSDSILSYKLKGC